MSNQTARIILFTMIFISSTASVSYAEIVDLVNGRTDVDVVSYIELNSAAGSVSAIQKMDLKAVFWTTYDNASVNEDGSVLFTNGRLIRRGGTGLETVEVPDANQTSFFGYPHLDRSGRILVYVLKEIEHATPPDFPETIDHITVFDTDTGEIIGRCTVRDVLSSGILLFDVSADANTLAYLYSFRDGSKRKIIVTDRQDRDFMSPIEIDVVDSVMKVILSSSGDRLYYGKTGTKYVDRVADGWTDPIPLKLPGDLISVVFYDAANDGKTLLVNIEERGLALVHETENGWSEPEYLGYQLDHHPLSNYVRIQMSEDGSVVAVCSARLPVVDPRSEALDIYDLYVFLRREPGVWKKAQVNLPEYPPFKGDYLLSQNGRMLYWVPETWHTSVTNPDWTLHR